VEQQGSQKFIAYYIDALQKASPYTHKRMLTVEQQKQAVGEFIGSTRTLLAEYTEEHDKKRKNFPILDQALRHCEREGATLLIVEMKGVLPYEAFTQPILHATSEIRALDLKMVSRANFEAVVEYAREKRETHRQLIMHGLQNTLAKLGNPNALKEITKVNKPKTENAVMFAMVLGVIVDDYLSQGYVQRRMMDTLNQQGFAAPEGGAWVLSQLQKVLNRIRVNDFALALTKDINEYRNKGQSEEQIMQTFIAKNVPPLSKDGWNLEDVKTILERIDCIKEIMEFNEFVLETFPTLEEWIEEGSTNTQIADKLNHQNRTIPERVIWERAQAEEREVDPKSKWDDTFVGMATALAERRRQFMAELRNNTFDAAYELLTEKMQQDETVTS
jgi:hypothetical protein